MEMSFATQEDIFAIMEPLMKELTAKFSAKKICNLESDGSFVKIPWREAMDRFGSDKPDLRYGLELKNLSEIFKNCGFAGFDEALKNDGVVSALKIPQAASFSRKVIDELKDMIKTKKIAAFGTITVDDEGAKSSLDKFIAPKILAEAAAALQAVTGDLLILVAGEWRVVSEALGIIRVACAKRLDLVDPNKAAYCWITDFPMYEYSEIKEGTIDFGHNPFSMPQGGEEALKSKHPLEILAYQYDLVLNGFEVSSGAVRNHEPELLYKVFALAGYEPEEVDRRFGGMIRAFKFGAPPHAGNAPGVDRILMVLNEWDSIRDMYAFPKDGQGRDLLMGSPSEVDDDQLKDLNIRVAKK
jgi:aspartyl-tRNA synthetase